jgi:integrative and conjugative element protein (TIGR02256 family)
MIEYPIGASGQVIVLSDEVHIHLLRHRQIGRRNLEAGGQLFARIEDKWIVVVEATGPRRCDRRTRTSYVPKRAAERAEIADRHSAGVHFIGDWHTHPDREPQPSVRDLESMAECFNKSAHELNGFVLVIVGLVDPPEGLHVSVHDGSDHYRIIPR